VIYPVFVQGPVAAQLSRSHRSREGRLSTRRGRLFACLEGSAVGTGKATPAQRLNGREGSNPGTHWRSADWGLKPIGPRIVILNFAKFTLHSLTIAGAEMLMGSAKTGLSLCSTDRNGDSAAGSACAGLGKFYNL
jgi:hypothetical protein